MLDANLIGSAQPLDWIVVCSDERGFAQQLIVRGEALPGASMDGAAKATNLDYLTPSIPFIRIVGFAN